MSHPLDGARAKVERAKEQIQNFDAIIGAFVNDPNTIVFQQDGDETAVRVRMNGSTTLQWSVIAGEIVHNLRSSLDHVAWSLTFGTGGAWTYFPVCKDRKEYETSGKGKLKGIVPAAQAVIEGLQPYHRAIGSPKIPFTDCTN